MDRCMANTCNDEGERNSERGIKDHIYGGTADSTPEGLKEDETRVGTHCGDCVPKIRGKESLIESGSSLVACLAIVYVFKVSTSSLSLCETCLRLLGLVSFSNIGLHLTSDR